MIREPSIRLFKPLFILIEFKVVVLVAQRPRRPILCERKCRNHTPGCALGRLSLKSKEKVEENRGSKEKRETREEERDRFPSKAGGEAQGSGRSRDEKEGRAGIPWSGLVFSIGPSAEAMWDGPTMVQK